ncbi:MAG: ABC transporter permease subunit [Saprospiraceae bacterium]|nr:ABC transporter permease subunit [Saprospiraceae bacterium]
MDWMFELRGKLTKRQSLVLGLIGVTLFFAVWILLTYGENPILRRQILPGPFSVFASYQDLLADNDLVVNTAKSIGLNLSGYMLALLITLPLGFVIGLFPLFRGLFQRYMEAIRFVPLTATLGLFIVWFGIGVSMKSMFMAFGIFIFLLPVVVQRIDEVKSVYLKTVYTLGATNWQTIRTVYIPSVMSRLWDDIRIMTAISWTYIVFIEANGSEGGIGDLLMRGAKRRGRFDKVFALLILIILIGVFQDKIFAYMDRKLFPHKYQAKGKYDHNSTDDKNTIWSKIVDYCWLALTWISLGLYVVFALDEFFGVLGNINFLTYLFADTVWVIHFIFLSMLSYKIYGLINSQKTKANGAIST